MAYTAQEIRHPAPRKMTLVWLAQMFVSTRGRGLTRYTLTQSVWAAYSHTFSSEELAPAYLAHLIQRQPLAQRLSAALAEGSLSAGKLDPARLRRMAFDRDITITLGTAIAWLDTLVSWGIFTETRRQYKLRAPLDVMPDVFPLLVWIWWHEHRQAQIPLDAFVASPLFAWFKTEDFAAGWAAQDGRVWQLTQVDGQDVALLQPHDVASFRRTLLNLLSTRGRDNRQQPRRGHSDESSPADPEQQARPGSKRQ